jgi:HAD superfamily hydrolase (TIGR01490 family)
LPIAASSATLEPVTRFRLALFDLDRTLLDGDSDLLWSETLGRRGVLDVDRVRAFHREYHAGTLDIHAFLAFQLAPLVREQRGDLLGWREEWLDTCIRPRICDAARALVREHAELGHELALITATNAWLTAPIARELEIPHLIATEPERDGKAFTGRVVGVPCFRAGKIERLKAWLAARGQSWSDVAESWFYSDSHNDLPLLEKVQHPVAVDPDPTLRAHAEAQGWPVISLRT